MNNKKSLLQDSLQELENIKNESLELAKEQLINESADLLEKKSAALFEKIIAGEDASEEESIKEEESKKEIVKAKQNGDKSYTVEYSDGTSKTIAVSNDAWDEINNKYGKSNIEESLSINEILNELSDMYSEEDDEEEEDDSDEEEEEDDSDEEEDDSDEEEEMSLDALRKAAEEQGFKLVADTDDEEEDMDSDEEEMDSDEEEMDDSDEDEDIEFGDEESDEDEFMTTNVDDKVLARPSDKTVNEGSKLSRSQKEYNKEVDKYKFFIVDLKKKKAVSGWEFQSDAKDALSDYDKDPNFKVVAARTLSSMGIENPKENFKNPKKINENNNKMRNTKKQVLKDLRDVSFNKLVEAYYNMDEEDSFVVKENEYMDDEDEMPDYSNIGQLEEYDDYEDENIDIDDDPEFERRMSGKKFKPSSRELKSMRPEKDDEYDPYSDIRKGDDYEDEMDEEMMYEIDMPDEGYMYEMSDDDINEMLSEMDIDTMHDAEEASGMDRLQKNSMPQKNELEEMFQEMSMEELEEMNTMLHEDGEGDGEGMSFQGKSKNDMKFEVNPEEDYSNLTEAEIEEMLDSIKEEEEMEESSAFSSQTQKNIGNPRGGSREGAPERRSGMLAEEEDEQLDEFFSGLKGAFGQAAAGIGKLGSTAKQAIGQYATEIGQAYQDAELTNEIKKLETLANNIGKQILALDSRRQRAGKGKLEPKDIVGLITTLSNQMRTGAGKSGNIGNVSLANTNIGQKLQQGQPQAQVQEDIDVLHEQVKKLKQEKATLQEGFVNKVKSLENKVYDVTISALKAGFVNKFLLEHPLRENEKLQIIHRFSNAQTKEQIKETYISLTNEFAKGQTVKDGSMLNESVQNKLGKIHRTDNAIVTEKNLMNENDESNRFKQLLNYNFNKKK
jgi:hypothetical protein